MLDEDQKSKPTTANLSAGIPLEYWHSTEPSPPGSLMLGIFCFAGLFVGLGLVVGCGGTLFGVVFDFGRTMTVPDRAAYACSFVAWLALLAFYAIALVGWVKDHRQLRIERRRTLVRFLTLGLLIGGLLGWVAATALVLFNLL